MEHINGYFIKTTLGSGGMARVYLAMQKSLERPVAIKILDATLIDDAIIQKQFKQESKLIACLNHPNIVQVIDQGITESGLPYFVMPFIKSISLTSILSREDISITRKMDILIQICSALAYAHRNNVVHRDIKPDNVLIDYDGHVRLVDFGIAGFFAANKNKVEKADVDHVMGTSDYMAPEQQQGNAHTNHLSDIYSLGILMHQVIFGVLPNLSHQGTYESRENDKFKFAEALRPLIDSAINPSPAKRPQTVEKIRQQLLLIAQGKHLRTNQWGVEKAQDSISSNYTMLDVLKENPFGATYLVNDPKRQRLLVIKKQHLENLGNAHTCSTKLTHVQHPHIARIFGTGKNSRVFITAMEFCALGNLQERLTHTFTLGQWILTAQQLCSALACAHSYGVIHGNLRPSNILFAEENHLKISDFGFPLHDYGEDRYWYHPTHETTSAITDIYAAGVVLFQLLTGKTPSHSLFGLKKWWQLRHIPNNIRSILLKMIEVKTKNRFESAQKVVDAFTQAQGEQKTKILNAILKTD